MIFYCIISLFKYSTNSQKQYLSLYFSTSLSVSSKHINRLLNPSNYISRGILFLLQSPLFNTKYTTISKHPYTIITLIRKFVIFFSIFKFLLFVMIMNQPENAQAYNYLLLNITFISLL